uniref:Uncharacterized protein n=1 Tax=Avena sativa TaxID=4498 RepID=A0ACD5W2G0_AVESA
MRFHVGGIPASMAEEVGKGACDGVRSGNYSGGGGGSAGAFCLAGDGGGRSGEFTPAPQYHKTAQLATVFHQLAQLHSASCERLQSSPPAFICVSSVCGCALVPQPPYGRAGSMEWVPEQQDLGDLGFAGICREIYRVGHRAMLPHREGVPGATILSSLLLAQAVSYWVIFPGLVDGDVFRFVAWLAPLLLIESTFMCVLLPLSLFCTAVCVFRVASLYCTDGNSDVTDRILRDLPRKPLAVSYIVFSTVALLLLLHLDVVPLQVLGGAACLASAAYVSVVSHIAYVVAKLEDGAIFGAVRKSCALLAGKLLPVAAIFVPLDVCFVALQVCFVALVLDDALGLGLWFKVAAGAAMAVALWAVVVVMLVAQPVVYHVCKNHHHEVVDMVHVHVLKDEPPMDVR